MLPAACIALVCLPAAESTTCLSRPCPPLPNHPPCLPCLLCPGCLLPACMFTHLLPLPHHWLFCSPLPSLPAATRRLARRLMRGATTRGACARGRLTPTQSQSPHAQTPWVRPWLPLPAPAALSEPGVLLLCCCCCCACRAGWEAGRQAGGLLDHRLGRFAANQSSSFEMAVALFPTHTTHHVSLTCLPALRHG